VQKPASFFIVKRRPFPGRDTALRNEHRISVGRPEWNIPLGKPRRITDDNNKVGPKYSECEDVD
jgi:hypothetical protein